MACDELHETLTLQLSELEILNSMFVDGKEFNVDQDSLVEIQDYLSGTVTTRPKSLTFVLSLSTSSIIDNERQEVLEVNCCLPRRYPHENPEVYVKCSALTRELQKELNEKTGSFLTGLELGELCILNLINWLQENWPDFLERSRLQPTHIDHGTDKGKGAKSEVNLSRLWLYMHHIYNKNKRKNILDWATECKLTGFSLPGKPGVVCVEGDERDTEEYFSRLRRLNWKKITCRHKEPKLTQRCFGDFQELVFRVHGSGDDRMSMGEFFQYLVSHNLGAMFKVLFGIEGKLNHDS